MRCDRRFKTRWGSSLIQIAAVWLLTLAGPARAADQPFDVVVTADSTHVMAGEKAIGELKKGTRLTVSQANADWYLIDLPDANPPQQGWIRKSDVQSVPATTTTAQLTPEQRQALLQERDRLADEVEKLRDDGRLDEAIAAAEKMLAIEQTVLGSDSPDALGSQTELASLHEAQWGFCCRPQVARKFRKRWLPKQSGWARRIGR